MTRVKTYMTDDFTTLLKVIRDCRHCEAHLPFVPRPIVQASPTAKICIIGQAPGRNVHETGIPWKDQSGERLRRWLNMTPELFYDAAQIAIIPMGFCYPGKGVSGDLPPRPECAPLWHQSLHKHLPDVRLTLLVGQYAQRYYLGKLRKKSLTDTVKSWSLYVPHGYFPLVHPSPLNLGWLQKNPWFEEECINALQLAIWSILNKT